MELTKIAVGIDFSPYSERAAKEAVAIARHTGAQVILVHAGTVVDHLLPTPSQPASREWEQIVHEQVAADRQALHALRERLAGQGPDVSHMVVDGFPDTALCAASKELGAQLVVTGTHGRTGFRRLLLGSVAEQTVRACEASVLVVRPDGDHSGGYRHILVPTDFSPHAEAALQTALVLAARASEIDLVHFWQLPMVAAGYYTPAGQAEAALAPLREAMTAEAESRGAELVAKYRRDGVEITFETVQAGTSQGILERLQADGYGYDLVCMGSHGRRGLRRFLLGSVAEATVRHSPCSVLVVHQGAAR